MRKLKDTPHRRCPDSELEGNTAHQTLQEAPPATRRCSLNPRGIYNGATRHLESPVSGQTGAGQRDAAYLGIHPEGRISLDAEGWRKDGGNSLCARL